jgi:hypothetical protein
MSQITSSLKPSRHLGGPSGMEAVGANVGIVVPR